jgi:Protein of unknown function (DUF1329)
LPTIAVFPRGKPDEDKGAAMADIYDLSGKLWRVKLSGAAPSYDIPAANYRGGLTYDLVNGTYYMSSHTAETGAALNLGEFSLPMHKTGRQKTSHCSLPS